jgi:uncharacterized membrane protein HdeD (DUF308 family)
MTLWQKIRNILAALGLILLGAVLIYANRFDYSVFIKLEGLDAETAEFLKTFDFHNIPYYIVLIVLSYALLFHGLHLIIFYFTMARHMNGGRSMLYRGVLFIDLAILTFSIQSVPVTYIMGYLIGLLAFSGAIDVFGALDARKIHGHWKLKMIRGLVTIAFAIYAFMNLNTPEYCVYIYSASLFYNALMRIISVFRHNDIVTIQ